MEFAGWGAEPGTGYAERRRGTEPIQEAGIRSRHTVVVVVSGYLLGAVVAVGATVGPVQRHAGQSAAAAERPVVDTTPAHTTPMRTTPAQTTPVPSRSTTATKPLPKAPPTVPPIGHVNTPNRCPKAAVACVDLARHLSWLQQGGKIAYGPVPAMPGAAGTSTPRGTFDVYAKDRHHISNEYNEPMPDAVFFAAGGIAFHIGSLKDSSHGCVHLSTAAADHYFGVLALHDEVAVF
ncbi:MAG: L,D-transpeptidase family protein [Mycobacteriales bacterium]